MLDDFCLWAKTELQATYNTHLQLTPHDNLTASEEGRAGVAPCAGAASRRASSSAARPGRRWYTPGARYSPTRPASPRHCSGVGLKPGTARATPATACSTHLRVTAFASSSATMQRRSARFLSGSRAAHSAASLMLIAAPPLPAALAALAAADLGSFTPDAQTQAISRLAAIAQVADNENEELFDTAKEAQELPRCQNSVVGGSAPSLDLGCHFLPEVFPAGSRRPAGDWSRLTSGFAIGLPVRRGTGDALRARAAACTPAGPATSNVQHCRSAGAVQACDVLRNCWHSYLAILGKTEAVSAFRRSRKAHGAEKAMDPTVLLIAVPSVLRSTHISGCPRTHHWRRCLQQWSPLELLGCAAAPTAKAALCHLQPGHAVVLAPPPGSSVLRTHPCLMPHRTRCAGTQRARIFTKQPAADVGVNDRREQRDVPIRVCA